MGGTSDAIIDVILAIRESLHGVSRYTVDDSTLPQLGFTAGDLD